MEHRETRQLDPSGRVAVSAISRRAALCRGLSRRGLPRRARQLLRRLHRRRRLLRPLRVPRNPDTARRPGRRAAASTFAASTPGVSAGSCPRPRCCSCRRGRVPRRRVARCRPSSQSATSAPHSSTTRTGTSCNSRPTTSRRTSTRARCCTSGHSRSRSSSTSTWPLLLGGLFVSRASPGGSRWSIVRGARARGDRASAAAGTCGSGSTSSTGPTSAPTPRGLSAPGRRAARAHAATVRARLADSSGSRRVEAPIALVAIVVLGSSIVNMSAITRGVAVVVVTFVLIIALEGAE